MLRHHFLLAYRSFWRNKQSFLINLIGLSTGIACTVLIYLWVNDELSFDKFHEQDEQLYQVMQLLEKNENDVLTWEWTPGILAASLKKEMPEVEQAIQVVQWGNAGIVANESTQFKADEIYAGKEFFNMFSFPLLEGDPGSVLQAENSVVLSEYMAKKLFQTTENLVGKTIEWKRNQEGLDSTYVISGIAVNPPSNSSLQFDLIFTYERFFASKPDLQYWYNSDPLTYITLREGTNIAAFNQKIKGFLKEKQENSTSTLFVRQFSDQYLYGNYENGVQVGGRISYVRLFSLIALFIILIACINFMNLSTAQSSKRSKEVGVKKTIGAKRSSLILQYLSESTSLAFLSLCIALGIVFFLLPKFNQITDKSLILNFNIPFLLICLGITLLTGMIAGSYPAFYLSNFKPVEAFKGRLHQSFGELWARKGLVVFQFSLSILLIVFVLVVYNQLQYVQKKNLGYERDNLLLLHKDGTIRENITTFMEEVRAIPGITKASTLDGNLTGDYGYTTTIRWEGYEKPENPIRFGVMIVGNDIVETLGMKMKQGKSFTEELKDGMPQVLLNEAALEAIGFENPIGKVIKQRRREYQIAGVVENFHFESLYDDVKPCILKKGTYGNNIFAKIQSGREQETIAQLEEVYAKFNPGLPFEFNFIDENYQQLYIAEQRVASLSRYFSGFAILISCLGLFGLAAFSAERRAKEMSIRKVLGASALNIAQLLSSDLVKLVFVAIGISLPLSFWFADKWLNTFAFHFDPNIWMFILAALAATITAVLTVSFQSIKIALANPIHSLRNE